MFRAVGEVGRLAPAPPRRRLLALRRNVTASVSWLIKDTTANLTTVSANCPRLITASEHVGDSAAAAADQHVYITRFLLVFLS